MTGTESRQTPLQRALAAAYRSPTASSVLSQLVDEHAGLAPDRFAEFTRTKTRDVEDEIAKLRTNVESAGAALQQKEDLTKALSAELVHLKNLVTELEAMERLSFVLGRVKDTAKAYLHKSPEFQRMFLEPRMCNSFVISVDIRRSTELMLKAREPESFARFVTDLCEALKQVIISNYGVFDKFTGDGILAFFPDFYSGDNVASHVLNSAKRCHDAFAEIYRSHRGTFTSVLQDTGLGIGVDYGKVNLVRIADGFTVVGPPVVYACRMSGGPAYQTLVNQPAYEVVTATLKSYCEASETLLNFKNEGETLCYSIRLNGRPPPPPPPDWERQLDAS